MQILIIIAVLILIVVILASRKPDEFSVTRSAIVHSDSQTVFPNINNLHLWEAWSPWARMDPNAKITYEGPDEGAGAVMKWEGNKKVGTGSMTIIESRPYEYIEMRLDFLKPMKGTSRTEFTFKPDGSTTYVTWNMVGKSNFMAKLMSLFINCEKMVSSQFDQGFTNLNEIVSNK